MPWYPAQFGASNGLIDKCRALLAYLICDEVQTIAGMP